MLLARIPLKMKFFLRTVSKRGDVFIVLQIGGIFTFTSLVLHRNIRQCSPKYFLGTDHIQSLYLDLKKYSDSDNFILANSDS